MTAREKVSVVIPNWNGKKWLPVCLDSLRKQTFRDFVVYVVDNGSKDGSVELIRDSYPEVRLIRNDSNLGFAPAVNIGIENSRGELIAALNNDTETDAGWLAEVAAKMDANPEYSSAASALLDFNDRRRIDSLGDGYGIDGRSYKIGSGDVFPPGLAEPFEILSPCGAASIYRRSLLDQIGLFDGDFFAYMEDIDLGLRAQLAGHRCMCIPTAKVYHMGSATSGGGASAFSVRQTTRNIFAVILKNAPWALIPVFIGLALASQSALVALSLALPRFRWFRPHLRAYAGGLGQAFLDIPRNWSKRRKAAPLRTIGTAQFIRLLSRSSALARDYAPKP